MENILIAAILAIAALGISFNFGPNFKEEKTDLMKIVILPSEWNSPQEPPGSYEEVIVKLEGGGIRVLTYAGGAWFNPDNGDDYLTGEGEGMDEIKGWARIVQQ